MYNFFSQEHYLRIWNFIFFHSICIENVSLKTFIVNHARTELFVQYCFQFCFRDYSLFFLEAIILFLRKCSFLLDDICFFFNIRVIQWLMIISRNEEFTKHYFLQWNKTETWITFIILHFIFPQFHIMHICTHKGSNKIFYSLYCKDILNNVTDHMQRKLSIVYITWKNWRVFFFITP